MKFVLSIVFIFTFICPMTSQSDTSAFTQTPNKNDSITQLTDTNKVQKNIKKTGFKKWWNAPYPSPKKALILSAILPGAGQVYNKKYWKLPIVAGLVGTFSYLIINNSKFYYGLKEDYILTLEGKSPINYQNIAPTNIKFYRDRYRYYLEQSYLWAFVSYAAIGIDAFVDAHLKSFDVSEDLSLQIKPKLNTYFGAPNPGIGLFIVFK